MEHKKVIICDAEEERRDAAMEIIRRTEGLEVCASTGDGERALELIAELQPDGLLMGLVTAGIDGLELLNRLNQMEVPRPKVLVCSAFVHGEITHKLSCLTIHSEDVFLVSPCGVQYPHGHQCVT